MTFQLATLKSVDGLTLHAPTKQTELIQFQQQCNLTLPMPHQEVLLCCNGIQAFGGYFRLFGVNNDNAIDMAEWNNSEVWKFAWGGKADEFWCFGETAWGQQYAYRISELKSTSMPKVYLLDHVDMEAEIIAESFAGFMKEEFIRCAREPYDDQIRLVRPKLGDISVNSHITYAPSLMIGGEENIENIMKLPAVECMVYNGDIYTQVMANGENRGIRAVIPYTDEQGRERMRVDFS